jgi:4-hydroxybenzoate polyprenyltransferase
MVRVRALIVASHPGPSLAITAMATVLVAEAAPRGFGPVLVAPAMLAGQLSVGWSNDACDAALDIAAGRTDKPVARGEVTTGALWIAAVVSLVASLAMSAVISLVTLGLMVLIIGAAWGYNLGLKSTPWSGVMYLLGFGPLPAFAASTLPGQPAPRLVLCVAAGLVGLGAHFANVLPDLDTDLTSGVRGLPQLVAGRWGPGTARAAALVLLLSASVLLVAEASPARRWIAIAGLCCSCVLAVVGVLGRGRTPFRAALAIAGADVAVFVLGADALTSAAHLSGSLGLCRGFWPSARPSPTGTRRVSSRGSSLPSPTPPGACVLDSGRCSAGCTPTPR